MAKKSTKDEVQEPVANCDQFEELITKCDNFENSEQLLSVHDIENLIVTI